MSEELKNTSNSKIDVEHLTHRGNDMNPKTPMKEINIKVPIDATDIMVTFKCIETHQYYQPIPDEAPTLSETIKPISAFEEKIFVKHQDATIPFNKLNTIHRILAAKEKYPNAPTEKIAQIANIGISTVSKVNTILKYGIPELQAMLRNSETNIHYMHRFMQLPVCKQKELISIGGAEAVKEYARSLERPRSSRRNIINIFQ